MLKPNDRKAELTRVGLSMSEIGRRLDPPASPTQVSEVVAGRRRSRRIEQAIADAIGMPIEAVFPPRHPSLAKSAA